MAGHRIAVRTDRSRAHALLALIAVATLAACGPSGGDGTGPEPTPSAEPSPVATSTAAPGIVAMQLGARGRATSVNGREWIAVTLGAFENQYAIVLPPDAGPDAGPLPVPGCALGSGPPACTANGTPRVVGESDWYAGYTPVELPSFTVDFPAAFGPAGEVVLLTPCCGSNGLVGVVVPAPGPRFLSSADVFNPVGPPVAVQRGVLWRTPGEIYETLPLFGFIAGPVPAGGDADGRIAGTGLDPVLPVVWLPAGDDFDLVPLPLLDGDSHGTALAIDAGRVAGWSSRGDDAKQAVVWEQDGDAGYAVQALPLPEAATRCTVAVAISGSRAAGGCARADGTPLAVVWSRGGGAAGWRVEALLPPLDGDAEAHVTGLSGDLAVGWSASGTERKPVAWRLS